MSHKTSYKTAGITHHIVQRGFDGAQCFSIEDDYLVYLDCLKEEAERHRCEVHAYVLLPDRVHLLASSDTEHRLCAMMRNVCRRYVEYVNYVHQHNGTFWARRESSVVDSRQSLLACYRAIESYPVRSGIAESPTDYRWSSHNHHALGCEDMVTRDHAAYLALGKTDSERQLAYCESFRQSLDERLTAEMGTPIAFGRAPAPVLVSDDIVCLAPQGQPRGGARPRTASHATAAF
jgi:REP-associated tyrosine transposase